MIRARTFKPGHRKKRGTHAARAHLHPFWRASFSAPPPRNVRSRHQCVVLAGEKRTARPCSARRSGRTAPAPPLQPCCAHHSAQPRERARPCVRTAGGRHTRRRARRKAASPRAEQQLRTQARRRRSLVAHCTACCSARAPGCARGCSQCAARAGSWCANHLRSARKSKQAPRPPTPGRAVGSQRAYQPRSCKSVFVSGRRRREGVAHAGARSASSSRSARETRQRASADARWRASAHGGVRRRAPPAHGAYRSSQSTRAAPSCAARVLRLWSPERTRRAPPLCRTAEDRDDAHGSAQRATRARTRCSGACALQRSAQRALQHHTLLRLRQGASEHRPGSRIYARQAAARRAEVLDSARTRCGAVLERARTFDKATYELA